MTDATISGSAARQPAGAPAPQLKDGKSGTVPSAPPKRQPPSSGVGSLGSAEGASNAPEQLADVVERVRLKAIRKWVNGDPAPAADDIYNVLKTGSIPSAGIDTLSPSEKQTLIACALDRLDAKLTSSLVKLVKNDKDDANLRDLVAHANLRGLVTQGLALKAYELLTSPPQSMARFDANRKA